MMEAIQIDKKVIDILQELSFQTPSRLIRDYMLTELLYRLSNFTVEAQHFEKKYGTTYLEFEKAYERGNEDFGKYDDLMAWKFAEEGKNYWSAKIEELKRVL